MTFFWQAGRTAVMGNTKMENRQIIDENDNTLVDEDGDELIGRVRVSRIRSDEDP
jgi:hypothetical protein